MNNKKEDGLLSLEASICLTVFIFLMLFMYSFFVVFETRNAMAHTILATADSLALDVYQTEKQETAGAITEILKLVYNNSIINEDETTFSSVSKWYSKETDNLTWNGNIYFNAGDADDTDYADRYGKSAYVSADFQNVLKDRFFSYLAGSTDDDAIDKVLDKFNVVDGKDGISFAGSKIVNGDLYIVIDYKLDYEFDMFDLLDIHFKQSACSKLWK